MYTNHFILLIQETPHCCITNAFCILEFTTSKAWRGMVCTVPFKRFQTFYMSLQMWLYSWGRPHRASPCTCAGVVTALMLLWRHLLSDCAACCTSSQCASPGFLSLSCFILPSGVSSSTEICPLFFWLLQFLIIFPSLRLSLLTVFPACSYPRLPPPSVF